MEYREIPPREAYGLMNCGGLIWVCTKSRQGRYDLAPLAWACPLDYEPVSRILFVSDPGHASYANLVASGEFAVALPAPSQAGLVEKTGSASGKEVDKYDKFSIGSFKAGTVDVLVPEGVGAFLECRLLRTVEEGSVSVVFGEVKRAAAHPEAWKERLHYVSEGLYYAPGPRLGPSSLQ
jgi:flavin reductase (DIM6/NTAB) family NADH-FMN oxidoreductase RutF